MGVGGPLKFSIYIGEADCFVKISNFRMFEGFQKSIFFGILGGGGGITSKFGYFYGLF